MSPFRFLALLWLLPSVLPAQRPTIEDFTLQGDAYLTDLDCFRLTEAAPYAAGSIIFGDRTPQHHPGMPAHPGEQRLLCLMAAGL